VFAGYSIYPSFAANCNFTSRYLFSRSTVAGCPASSRRLGTGRFTASYSLIFRHASTIYQPIARTFPIGNLVLGCLPPATTSVQPAALLPVASSSAASPATAPSQLIWPWIAVLPLTAPSPATVLFSAAFF
jgi:hypothetical protein